MREHEFRSEALEEGGSIGPKSVLFMLLQGEVWVLLSKGNFY